MRDDELLELIGRLDPTRADAPPAPGSSRYTAIEEQAMATNTAVRDISPQTTDPTDGTAATDGIPGPHRSASRRRWPVAAAAAAVALVVGGAVVLQPGSERSAEATVTAAAEELADVTNLRMEMTFDNTLFGEGRIIGAASGFDYDQVWERSTGDGGTESQHLVTVDDFQYRTDATGQTTRLPIERYDQTDASFAQSSAAVVSAVAESAEVEEVGSDEVRGVEATRYRVEIPDASESALADLTEMQLDWFGLIVGEGSPLDKDVTVDIWVADGLIRRIDISAPDFGTQSAEIYDVGADITVTPPPGPYAEVPELSDDG
jgi:hypothetical protein